MPDLAPATPDALCDAIAEAAREGICLEIRGGGSKAAMGAACNAKVLDMRGFAGIIDYDPPELVLTVGAATPLVEIEPLLAGQNQMLAFEPWDPGPLFGNAEKSATIGGIVAAGLAGPRRLSMGAARDHLLGFKAVSGRAQFFTGGAKVVKNVTGYDLPKLLAGSWGRIAALTELTLKVLPLPETHATLAIEGLNVRQAQAAMAHALGSRAEIAAAAHLPGHGTSQAQTLFRLHGFEPSVKARVSMLVAMLAEYGMTEKLGETEAAAAWQSVREVTPLAGSWPLWRVNIPPSGAPQVVAALEPLGARWLLDWAGGLVWLAFDGDPMLVRRTAEQAGGHAMLVRAPAELRAGVAMQHPRPPGLAALEARVRRVFDPSGVFETGRFSDQEKQEVLF